MKQTLGSAHAAAYLALGLSSLRLESRCNTIEKKHLVAIASGCGVCIDIVVVIIEMLIVSSACTRSMLSQNAVASHERIWPSVTLSQRSLSSRQAARRALRCRHRRLNVPGQGAEKENIT